MPERVHPSAELGLAAQSMLAPGERSRVQSEEWSWQSQAKGQETNLQGVAFTRTLRRQGWPSRGDQLVRRVDQRVLVVNVATPHGARVVNNRLFERVRELTKEGSEWQRGRGLFIKILGDHLIYVSIAGHLNFSSYKCGPVNECRVMPLRAIRGLAANGPNNQKTLGRKAVFLVGAIPTVLGKLANDVGRICECRSRSPLESSGRPSDEDLVCVPSHRICEA